MRFGSTCVILWVVLAIGCTGSQRELRQSLQTVREPGSVRELETYYQVRYPDVLAVRFDGRPDLSGLKPLQLDGRICIHQGLHVLVEGLSLPQIARELAAQTHLPLSTIQVQVQEYASQFVYLYGEVDASQHIVPYRGPETILSLFRRIGGIPPEGSLQDIRVVRAHVADGKPPEVFHIDLPAILSGRDLQTNIRLEPFDRIHIGSTRSSSINSMLPPWLKQVVSGQTEQERMTAGSPSISGNNGR